MADDGAKLLSILAFIAGTVIVRTVQRYSPRIGWSSSVVCLLAEMAVLAPMAVIAPKISNVGVTTAVAFAAAVQFTGFAETEAGSYSSIATTGNLRRLVDAVFLVIFPTGDPAAHRKAKVFASICLVFPGGAVAGALATKHWHDLAILVPVGCHLLVLGLLVRSKAAE